MGFGKFGKFLLFYWDWGLNWGTGQKLTLAKGPLG